jgi:putative transposase
MHDQARHSIANYLIWYSQRQPHSSLADRTPDEALPALKRQRNVRQATL